MPPSPKNIMTVSQLNRQAKYALEQNLPSVWVQGELTNLAQPSSGHWYFTLKDNRAQVRCAMFRGKNIMVREPIRSGDQIVCSANVSLYEGRGDYQLIVNSLQKAGLGDLHQQYEALKNALAAEGLFNTETKRPLPPYPKTIGVISSPTGAAVHDVLTVLKRRYPQAEVIIYPAAVQGAEAPASLLKALSLANRQARCDILIIGRGGGSLEDLWAFNSEPLVRAVYASETPIISAVGHEVDFTLTDFAADLRAPTPSAAAEAATPNVVDIRRAVEQQKRRLVQLISAQLQNAKRSVALLKAQLQSPKEQLRHRQQQLDHLELQLKQAMKQRLREARQQLKQQHHQLQLNSPVWQVKEAKSHHHRLVAQLRKAMQRLLELKKQQLSQQAALLNSVSPLQTLQRGYAIVRTEQGRVIAKTPQAQRGQAVSITLADGTLDATVTAINTR
ncbi:MAG TPA: exodeoxyribonuclease VII large subunit [Marinagarivorans sp.]